MKYTSRFLRRLFRNVCCVESHNFSFVQSLEAKNLDLNRKLAETEIALFNIQNERERSQRTNSNWRVIVPPIYPEPSLSDPDAIPLISNFDTLDHSYSSIAIDFSKAHPNNKYVISIMGKFDADAEAQIAERYTIWFGRPSPTHGTMILFRGLEHILQPTTIFGVYGPKSVMLISRPNQIFDYHLTIVQVEGEASLLRVRPVN